MHYANYLIESDDPVYQAVISFLKIAQQKTDLYYAKCFQNLPLPHFEIKTGGKFYKIIKVDGHGNGGSAWAFIDKKSGDIFKPASYAAPAKHARGNVLSSDNGIGAVTPNGVGIVYLK